MKVGILTFSRTINYGALLQCYALQETLIQLGYEVFVIDYKQPYVERGNALFLWDVFLGGGFIKAMRYVKNIRYRYPYYKKKESFRQKYLHLTKSCSAKNIPQNFDIYIIGSDQLWTTTYTGGVDSVYWGIFKRKSNSQIFSYGISVNQASLDEIPVDSIHKNLSNFKVVSVRENKIKNYLETKFAINVRVDVDPTLLANKEIYTPLLKNQWEKRRYIVMYQVRRLSWNVNHLFERARQLAEELNCELIDLSQYQYTADEFISAINYSQAVVTTSFHGTAFSLILHKPFVCYCLNDGHDGRNMSLLESLGLSQCLQSINEHPRLAQIDFVAIDTKLQGLRDSSLSYLKGIEYL